MDFSKRVAREDGLVSLIPHNLVGKFRSKADLYSYMKEQRKDLYYSLFIIL